MPKDGCVLGFFGQMKRKKGGLFFLENLLRSGLADKSHLLFVGEAETEMHEWLKTNRDKINFNKNQSKRCRRQRDFRQQHG
ncbi:MAG: hypothetical protein M3Q78_11745 [Acidobacteriota bacterium]|nr:hypothetical protein [Acidobacteriota bacterium]